MNNMFHPIDDRKKAAALEDVRLSGQQDLIIAFERIARAKTRGKVSDTEFRSFCDDLCMIEDECDFLQPETRDWFADCVAALTPSLQY